MIHSRQEKLDIDGTGDNKQLLDKVTVDIKIYSVETSNTRWGLTRVKQYLARLNKFDNCHRRVQSLFHHP